MIVNEAKNVCFIDLGYSMWSFNKNYGSSMSKLYISIALSTAGISLYKQNAKN